MRLVFVMVAWLATSGTAMAVGIAGYQGGGNGVDPSPLAGGCVCYGYGLGYGLTGDEAGHFGTRVDEGGNLGWYDAEEVPLHLGRGRWFEASANPLDGGAQARTDGFVGVNGAALPAGAFLGMDALLRVDRSGDVHVEAHDNLNGALWQHVGLCVQASPDPPGVGADLFTHVNGVAPLPTGLNGIPGPCRFET